MDNPLRLAAAALAVLFAALAVVIGVAGRVPGDEWVLVELDRWLGTTLDEPMVALGAATDLLPLGVAGLGLAALLLWRGRRSDAVLLLSILGVAMVGNRVLKELVARPRPEVRSVPEALSTYSFPSGHAASTAAMAGALVLLTRTPGARARVAAAGIVLVVAVAISRLAVGAHYPSDIIGGWLWIGALIAFAAARMKTRGESTDAR